jgi:hypothetical protein
MEGIVELVVEVIGAIVRALFEVIFGRIAVFVGSVYDRIHQTVRWNLRSDFLATPVTLLLMLALGRGNFFRSRQGNPVDDRLRRATPAAPADIVPPRAE